MISKDHLEEAIRGVIQEFRQTKRIPDPAAEELTAALEARVEDLFESEEFSYTEVEDSADYVSRLRNEAQKKSAEGFLREIISWQESRS